MGWPWIDIVVETSWFKKCWVGVIKRISRTDFSVVLCYCVLSTLGCNTELGRWLRNFLGLIIKRNYPYALVLCCFIRSLQRNKLLSWAGAKHAIIFAIPGRHLSLFCFTDVNEKSKIVAIREWLYINQRDPESRADRWSRRAFASEYYLSENAVVLLCLTCKSNFTFEKSVERVCRYCESPYCCCVYVLGKWCRCIGFSLLWLLCRKLFELQQLG